jgi:Tfp pilus assembly protein PilF
MSRKKDPVDASDTHNERGIELASRGWFDEAINEFRKAVALDPLSAHAHDNLAGALVEKKKFREALGLYLKAIDLEDDAANGHYNLGCFLLQYGNEFAKMQFQEAIALEPDFADAHLNLGIAMAEEGEFDDAIKSVRQSLIHDETLVEARLELARLLMEREDFREAISQLKEAVKMEPTRHDAWTELGVAYAMKGFHDEAERAFMKAEDLKPDDPLVRYGRARLSVVKKQFDEAMVHLTKAFDFDAKLIAEWLRSDAEFDALRDRSDFNDLLRRET